MHQPMDVLGYWRDEVGPKGWYEVRDAVDGTIRHRFGELWEEAREGGLRQWQASPDGALAYLILTDQFPRNMFRGEARAFATDALARDCATRAIASGHDQHVEGDIRQFFYLPFVHSEDLQDQERAIALFERHMPGDNLRHARAHAEVIRRFGRFPFRNEALGRASTAEEAAFMSEGGYAALVRNLPQ